ncbi:hypothetical protein [Streptococcus suis]|uniref:Uncharacterized protein n=1 Tax=Streptococcus suis TaxID=1307 RepID=A0A116KNX1_STRSU|nr:hypothetical protein [Streptococcus suis]QBX30815.1 hypothetical protein Javan576_0027 [Streptococcus phage Javan576]NQH78188.1 hypothetical protein [Streptococcus suis]NQN75126.1 hypothetical protein [Streptococcus suis]CYU47894.1 Uncharacterised protein [Streptococcus suis]CYU61355.1 Uncharacterised protein [Streptococcus suis]
MRLLQYNNKKVKLLTKTGNVYQGRAYFCDAEDYETEEDELTIKNELDKKFYGFSESEIKSIEII